MQNQVKSQCPDFRNPNAPFHQRSIVVALQLALGHFWQLKNMQLLLLYFPQINEALGFLGIMQGYMYGRYYWDTYI
jgi:hypothetical protein